MQVKFSKKGKNIRGIESGPKKNETNVLHDCVNTNQKTKNLIKSANC